MPTPRKLKAASIRTIVAIWSVARTTMLLSRFGSMWATINRTSDAPRARAART